MKYYKKFNKLFLTALILVTVGCENYLTVDPIDRLTGNNYYLSKDDVESNFAYIYSTFFDKIQESWVIGATGEARSGEIGLSLESGDIRSRPINPDDKQVLTHLGRNDLLTAINLSQFDDYKLSRITDWTGYYKVIQSANILISKLEEGIPGVSSTEKDRYIAEAKFMRSFTYFWMVRLWGDVVYYTEPYFSESIPREDMVSVLNKCIADLEPEKNNISWTHGDPAERGARPARGAIIALLMHMNAWNANFDVANKESYLTKVADLGKELIESGAHRLYEMTEESWAEVAKGRSEESLFEFYRSVNYGDTQWYSENNDNFDVRNHYMVWSHFLRWPYVFPRHNKSISPAYFLPEYMDKIYPENESDKRREIWFENINSGTGDFLLKKYAYNVYASGNEDGYPDNSIIIFRYSDAILLYAESLAELGRNTEAATAVNLVRNRAGAAPFAGGGDDLKNFIFLERCRELIGEGHRYFDLIRTRRIMNSEWTNALMNIDQYNRRAWTWPVNSSARNNNPYIVLNEYWTTTGR